MFAGLGLPVDIGLILKNKCW